MIVKSGPIATLAPVLWAVQPAVVYAPMRPCCSVSKARRVERLAPFRAKGWVLRAALAAPYLK